MLSSISLLFMSRHSTPITQCNALNRLRSSQIVRQWFEMIRNSSQMVRIHRKSSQIALFTSESSPQPLSTATEDENIPLPCK